MVTFGYKGHKVEVKQTYWPTDAKFYYFFIDGSTDRDWSYRSIPEAEEAAKQVIDRQEDAQ
jgi:hypothetical protein